MRPPERTPRTLGLVHLNNGTAAWRIFWPMEYLSRRGYPVAYGMNGLKSSSGMIQDADLVVLHRLAWLTGDEKNAYQWRDLLHSNGKALCYEIDDDILSQAIIERVHRTGDAGKTDEQIDLERKQHLFSIQVCDGVICSTPRIAEICRGITDRPVIVVPNAIDLDRFRLILSIEPPPPEGAPPTVCWIGGNRPDRDAENLAIAWNRISRKYPSVIFRVGGYPLPVLCDSVPPDRLELVPWRPIEAYQRTYAGITIGCAPLHHEPFNLAKSVIKAYEYAAARAAVVASPTTYGEVIRHGENGMLAESPEEWTEAISTLLDNPDQRQHLAATLLQEVERDHSLRANAWRWPEAWNTIVTGLKTRLLSSKWGGGSTFGRSLEYDTSCSPILRA